MISSFVASLAGLITFTTLDYIWLAHIAKDFYLNKLAGHVSIQDGALVPYLPAVPLVYIVALIGIWVFVLGRVTTVGGAFLYGALLGFVLYAFYDLTNLATLRDYPWSLTLVDILWGTLLVATVTTVMWYVRTLLA